MRNIYNENKIKKFLTRAITYDKLSELLLKREQYRTLIIKQYIPTLKDSKKRIIQNKRALVTN